LGPRELVTATMMVMMMMEGRPVCGWVSFDCSLMLSLYKSLPLSCYVSLSLSLLSLIAYNCVVVSLCNWYVSVRRPCLPRMGLSRILLFRNSNPDVAVGAVLVTATMMVMMMILMMEACLWLDEF